MSRFHVIGVLAWSLFFCPFLQAQPSLMVPPVTPTKYQDCLDLSERWMEKAEQVRAAESVCERRDDGKVSYKGIRKPACNALQHVYLKCASLSNQLCAVRAQKDEAVSQCNRAYSAYQRAEQDKKSLASRLERQIGELNSARDAMSGIADKGPTGYLVDRMTETPQGAAARFNDAMKEAARTTGAPGADSQPAITRAGEVSDRAFRLVPGNPVAIEIGSQSAAAARARMADALSQFDGVKELDSAPLLRPSQGVAPGTVSPRQRRAIEQEEQEEERRQEQIDRSDAAERFEMMRRMNEMAQQTLRQLTPPGQGAPTFSPGRSPTSRPGRQGPDCRPREMVCSVGQSCKRRCTVEEERSLSPKD
jgi:hypothetical protein